MITLTKLLKANDEDELFNNGLWFTDYFPIQYKKTNPNAITPTEGSNYAAGFDLYVPRETEEITLLPHETKLIDIGIAIELPIGTFGAIVARSGLATKQGLRPANCMGVVDADYRGSIGVALHNDSNEERHISAGERIAQLVILPYINFSLKEVDELSTTDRGSNGFGSTGK